MELKAAISLQNIVRGIIPKANPDALPLPQTRTYCVGAYKSVFSFRTKLQAGS